MLRLPPIRLIRPPTLTQALIDLATAPTPRVLAGGTDLLVALKLGHGLAAGDATPVLSLADLALSGIQEDGDHWHFGATTTLWDLVRWRPPADQLALGVISEAARQVAAPPLQSRATLGGNLCLDTRCVFFNQSAFWRSGRPACRKAGGDVCHVAPGGDRCFACHQGDLAPVMIALGASVRLGSATGERDVPVEGLYSGEGKKPLNMSGGELLTRATVPAPPRFAGAAWEKIRMRQGLDFAAASVAVYLEAEERGVCTDARVVLGALGSGPIRVPEAEEALRATRLEPEALEAAAEASRKAARPMKNVDLTPPYRRQVAGVVVSRASKRAWDMALRDARSRPMGGANSATRTGDQG